MVSAKWWRMLAVMLVALTSACGGTSPTSTAGPATATSGSERPVVRTIEPSASASAEPPHVITREEFDAQWAERRTATAPVVSSEWIGAPSGLYAAYGGLGADIEHPISTCGPGESYTAVASYVCPDGSMPLGGDPSAGAAARVGNVGANATGHIIDLYEVPCATGAVQLYVDLYGCPGGGMPF